MECLFLRWGEELWLVDCSKIAAPLRQIATAKTMVKTAIHIFSSQSSFQ